MKKTIFAIYILSLLISCKKEISLREKITGVYTSHCRLVEYKINQTGIYDSTVYNRNYFIDVEMSKYLVVKESLISIHYPSLSQNLARTYKNEKNGIYSFENYYEPVPDGVNDTLSVKINTLNNELSLKHIGRSSFYFPGGAPFTSVIYIEECSGIKKYSY